MAALIAIGANVNVHAHDGDTALHDAVENGHTDVVALLVKAGASATARNSEGRTPYDLASDEPGMAPTAFCVGSVGSAQHGGAQHASACHSDAQRCRARHGGGHRNGANRSACRPCSTQRAGRIDGWTPWRPPAACADAGWPARAGGCG